MALEVVNNAKFIYVYVVQRIYSFSSAKSYTPEEIYTESGWMNLSSQKTSKPIALENLKIVPYRTSTPPNVIEVYLCEDDAVKRSEQLANIQDKYPYISKISTTKSLAVTCNEGKTVSIIDRLNTFEVSSII